MENNFLVTIGLIALLSLGSVGYILYYSEPNYISFIFLLFGVFFAISTLVSLLWFKFTKIARFDDSKVIFRNCFKKSVIIGVIVSLFILIQFYFDLL